jgi:xanthine dehydrogenase YagS FAD-binding subunit
MSLPRFDYMEPKSLEEAVAFLEEHRGKARVLAGGTDLLGAMKDRVDTPEVLVNIGSIGDLDYIRETGGTLTIGALTKLRSIVASPILQDRYNMLSQASSGVGGPAIRNMGTIAGNLCQKVRCWYYRASPWCGAPFVCYRKGGDRCYAAGIRSSDGLGQKGYLHGEDGVVHGGDLGIRGVGGRPLFFEAQNEVPGDSRYHSIIGAKICHAVCPSDMAPALVAMDAKLRVTGRGGDRWLAVEDLWLNEPPWLSIKDDEIISELEIPASRGQWKGTFLKYRVRRAMDFALVSVAAAVENVGDRIGDARIVLGGVAPTPWRAYESEAVLKGDTGDRQLPEAAAAASIRGVSPLAMNAYKVQLVQNLVKKAILDLGIGVEGKIASCST